jgi:rhamnulose-1-phosphate aldolase/alcohol dehydrogenase
MKLDGFATLYQHKLLSLEQYYGGPDDDDKMVGYLPHCTFNLNGRAASIDTPLHSLLPFAHVDHVHPDAIIALAASSGGEAATQAIWGGRIGWLPWKRPGYTLGVQLRDYVAANPQVEGVMLAGHGIICWADSARACYEHTVELIADAANHLNSKLAGKTAFGGASVPDTASAERAATAAHLMPRLRSLMTGARRKVGHFSDDAEALEFVNSVDFQRLADLGTSCPDHFLRTKIAPLTLDPKRVLDDTYLAMKVTDYRAMYASYYERSAGTNSPAMRDPNPVVVLVPGVGRMTFATDKTTARLAGEFYGNAINVMRGAEAIGDYIALDEQEAFDIEYWQLEEAKLQRMPAPRPLVGRVALVTGGAGGIGAASAARLMADGACVMLADRDAAAIEEVRAGFAQQFGKDVVRAVVCDVTDEAQVAEAFAAAAREFGGLDILVANAGIASSAPLEETTIEL